MGDISKLKTRVEIRDKYIEVYKDDKPAKTSNAVSMLAKFRDVITKGEVIVSYSSESHECLYGIDKGKYT
jgi:predicted Mrr-cat superfamily restriction endonuclease